MGELVQVPVHTPHAEPLGVEETAVRSDADRHRAQAAAGAQHQEPLPLRAEGVSGHETLLEQRNGSGVWWFLAVVSKRAA